MRKILFLLHLIVALIPMISAAEQSAESGNVTRSCAIDSPSLEGDWVRPDGGYILLIRDINENGSVNATYLNPKRINVAIAKIELKNCVMILYVELRDVNYPGSSYTLRYDPTDDRLKGSYYQAALSQTFEVEFLRIK